MDQSSQDQPTPEESRFDRFRARARRAAVWTRDRARGGARRVAANERLMRGGKIVLRDVAAAGLLALLVLAGGKLLFERVEPGSIGVRQKNWGSAREIDRQDYAPGIYFGPRFLYSWHRVDARTNVISFARPSAGGEHPPLEVRTPKGPTAQVAVRVPFRVIPGSGHQLVADGVKTAYRMRVKSTVEKILVQELSKLEIDELSDPAARQRTAERALTRLDTELAAHHVRAEGVFVEAVYFQSTYEKKMQEQQLADQTQQTNTVLHQLKLVKLESDGLQQEIDQAREAEIAAAKRRLEEEQALWVEGRIEDQKIEVQALELELAREKQRKLDELARGFAAVELEERTRAVEALELEAAARAQELAQRRQETVDELSRDLETARRVGHGQLAVLRDEAAAAELALQSERSAERARLDLELAAARAAHTQELAGLEGATRVAAAATRREGDRAYDAQVAEGDRALAVAHALRDELEAQALTHPGARLVLAREAAENLNLERVALDSKDARVPSVLDLDELTALLVGARE